MTEELIVRMFAAYNRKPDSEQAAAYLETLQVHADDVLEAAIRRAKSESPTFPPTAPAIDVAVRAIMRERAARTVPASEPDHSRPLAVPIIVPLPTGQRIAVTREWYHDCDVCRDTAWQDRWCPGGAGAASPREWWPEQACGRRHAENDAGHTWAAPCPCAATNPTIRRRHHPGRAAA